MRRIPLVSSTKFAIVSTEDYEAVSTHIWRLRVQNTQLQYAYTRISGKVVMLQNLIMQPSDGRVVDHISGNGLNNMRSNLRVCSPKQNAYNSRKCRATKTSKYKGVSHKGGTWQRPWAANIVCEGRSESLGSFPTQKEAAAAYNEAAVYYFGEFANLNKL